MIPQETLLVTLVKLVDRVPEPPKPPVTKRGRGRQRVYTDRLFLKALVIMLVRRLYKVGELLAVLQEPTAEMHRLQELLTEQGKYPCERTFRRRLAALPDPLPAQIGCLGRYLVACINPWAQGSRAFAMDSTVLRAKGGVWHKRDRKAGGVKYRPEMIHSESARGFHPVSPKVIHLDPVFTQAGPPGGLHSGNQ